MSRIPYIRKSAAWVISLVLLLASCRAILDIKTNEADLDCKVLMEDAYCIKVRTAEIESVKDLVIDQDKILSIESSFKLSWTMPETAKRILGTKVRLASDAACKVEVTAADLDVKELSYKFSDIKDGIYYGCVFANAKSALLVGAKNNGIRIVVETAKPIIEVPANVIYVNSNELQPNATIKALSAVKYLWTVLNGPGELSFSDATAAKPSFKATVDGSYIVSVKVTNEVGGESSQTLTVVYDTTPPVIKDLASVSVPVATNTSFNISFALGIEANPAGYNIKACTSGCTTGCVGATTTVSSPGTISGSALTNGNSYRGCIQGKDLAGNISAWVQSTGLVIFDTTLPNAPSSLVVPAYSNSTSVNATFSVGNDANMRTHSFKACTSNNCSTGCLPAVQAPTSPATLTGLVNGTAYYACGQAVDLAGNVSSFSNSASTITIDTAAPGNPTAVSVPATSANSIAISFTGGAEINPDNFNIKACLNNTCNVGCVGATTAASSPGTIASAALSNGTPYYGCVQGTDLAGNTSGFAASSATVLYSFLSTTYNGNGSTGGSVPTDATQYASGATVTVLGNTGSLVKSGYTFLGWNAVQNLGTSTASFTISANTTLYAQWTVACTSMAGGTYVMVPGDNIYGTSSFCVQKYAASNVASVPTSQTGTAPWVSINQTDSIAKCAALGAGYHLITNPEWMTLAANLANVGSNWSSGTVGVGTMRRGHSDANPNNACAANASDANAYVETDCTGTSSGTFVERRSTNLSNGSVVWDIGGNVWNWIYYNNAADKPTPATYAFYEYTAITGSTTTPRSHLVPLNSVQSWWTDTWNSTQGIGQIWPGANGSAGALRRGEYWGDDANVGPFSADLDVSPSSASSRLGFRCAYTPATFTLTYDANTATGGSPPNDPTLYASGSTVTVQNNPIALAKTSYTFAGWNTLANGTGTQHAPGATFSISANTILYARWINCTGLAGGTWVQVPGDSIYGTTGFCVQKYAPSNVSFVPTSQTGTAPYAMISQNSSITVCAGLGTGFHLITNPEWMTIAANLANVGSNWSGSSVGSGSLRRGHSDGSPNSACAADASDANAYVQTTCTGTSSGTFVERRTSTLSNGAVVWDIGGNVGSWVNYNNSADKPTPYTGSYIEYTTISGSNTTPKSHLVPLNIAQSWWTDSWNSTQGIGQILPNANGSGGALVRGGHWFDSANAGAFSANLAYNTLFYSSVFGFRCTWQP